MLPAQLTTDVLPGPGGQRVVLMKLAVPGACVTALVSPEDAQRWLDQFAGHVAQARTGLIQSIPNGGRLSLP